MGAEACSQSESNTCAAKSRGRAWPHRFRTAQLYVQLSLLIKLLLLMRGWTQYQINQIVGGYTQLHAEELPTITPMMFNTHCSTR